MPRIRLIALAAMMATGAAHLADAGQTNNPAQVQANAQSNRGELSLTLAQDAAAQNPWAVTSASGVNIQSRAGFVGYH